MCVRDGVLVHIPYGLALVVRGPSLCELELCDINDADLEGWGLLSRSSVSESVHPDLCLSAFKRLQWLGIRRHSCHLAPCCQMKCGGAVVLLLIVVIWAQDQDLQDQQANLHRPACGPNGPTSCHTAAGGPYQGSLPDVGNGFVPLADAWVDIMHNSHQRNPDHVTPGFEHAVGP